MSMQQYYLYFILTFLKLLHTFEKFQKESFLKWDRKMISHPPKDIFNKVSKKVATFSLLLNFGNYIRNSAKILVSWQCQILVRFFQYQSEHALNPNNLFSLFHLILTLYLFSTSNSTLHFPLSKHTPPTPHQYAVHVCRCVSLVKRLDLSHHQTANDDNSSREKKKKERKQN